MAQTVVLSHNGEAWERMTIPDEMLKILAAGHDVTLSPTVVRSMTGNRPPILIGLSASWGEEAITILRPINDNGDDDDDVGTR